MLCSESFIKAKPHTLVTIYGLENLNIMYEIDLLSTLVLYAEANEALPEHCLRPMANQERFNTMVLPALKLIHLTSISTTELVTNHCIKDLLIPEQVLGIIAHQLSPDRALYDMPPGFSTNGISRGFRDYGVSRPLRSNVSSRETGSLRGGSSGGLKGNLSTSSRQSQNLVNTANAINSSETSEVDGVDKESNNGEEAEAEPEVIESTTLEWEKEAEVHYAFQIEAERKSQSQRATMQIVDLAQGLGVSITQGQMNGSAHQPHGTTNEHQQQRNNGVANGRHQRNNGAANGQHQRNNGREAGKNRRSTDSQDKDDELMGRRGLVFGDLPEMNGDESLGDSSAQSTPRHNSIGDERQTSGKWVFKEPAATAAIGKGNLPYKRNSVSGPVVPPKRKLSVHNDLLETPDM